MQCSDPNMHINLTAILFSVNNCDMILNIKFVLSALLHFVTIVTSMKVYDLFLKPSGSTVKELHKSCSYPCENISDKMVTLVTGSLNL